MPQFKIDHAERTTIAFTLAEVASIVRAHFEDKPSILNRDAIIESMHTTTAGSNLIVTFKQQLEPLTVLTETSHAN